MKRTDADGNDGNLFTDGDPGVGDPATVVEETWLNNVQEEIANVVEAAGITLDGMVYTQLLAAIQVIANGGGSPSVDADFSIANNQVAAANLAGLLWAFATYRAVRIYFHLERRTNSVTQVVETGEIYLYRRSDVGTWDIDVASHGDNGEVEFAVDATTGQLSYTSSNMAGAGYAGTLRITDVRTIKV